MATLGPCDLDRRRRRSTTPLAPPRSFGGSSFDPSEGLSDAAEDLLRALRAEPGVAGSSSGESIGGSSSSDSSSSSSDSGSSSSSSSSTGEMRAEELAADGMWPLYQALGDFADLLDLSDRARSAGDDEGSGGDNDDSDDGAPSLRGGSGADAEALALLRSRPSLLLLPRFELARRIVLLKTAAGSGADAAALARRLPWLLSEHRDPGEVVRRAMKQMLALMPGVGGAPELGARLFGSNSGGKKNGGKRRTSGAGRASQAWLTFADIARGESRKMQVEEREREAREREAREREG